MYLLESWSGIQQWDVEIIASDIDTSIIRRARAGRYSARSVQYLPDPWLKRYFESARDEYQLCDDLRQAVRFTRVNLAEPADTLGYRNFDVIFCRNLLIYFDDASRRTASETFFEALNPGGYLCLGHSESMSRISSLFEVRKFPEAIVYQKHLEAK
jgi:chemotaxis protein methyltransferase CheR